MDIKITTISTQDHPCSHTTHTPPPSFSWPAPPRPGQAIIPFFLPFSGCPCRCIFCAQQQQSGTGQRSVKNAIHELQQQLEDRCTKGLPPAEIGFFGGTFTALPPEDMALCLEFTAWARQKGLVQKARCSTRPDALHVPHVLEEMRHAGFTTVELGIQSFDNAALDSAKRHYKSDLAHAACRAVREAGLTLGVQLLPGMPGVSPHVFLRDVTTALHQGAAELRFYPCLVLEGTELAEVWRKGLFLPWNLEETLDTLARGWLAATGAGAKVLRMGLAPEPGLEKHILAGPRHPALGGEIKARALLAMVRQASGGRTLTALRLPRHCQGYFWGDKASLAPVWAELGLVPKNVRWHAEDVVCLELCAE